MARALMTRAILNLFYQFQRMDHLCRNLPRILGLDLKQSTAPQAVGAITAITNTGIPAQANTAVFRIEIIRVGMTAADGANVTSLQDLRKQTGVESTRP